MNSTPDRLRDNIRTMGELLGDTLLAHEGEALFNKVEEIRTLSKTLSQTKDGDTQALIDLLGTLDDTDILPIVRSFNQFLNLSNIVDQDYYTSANAKTEDGLDTLLHSFGKDYTPETLIEAIQKLNIELVLTAHPTEVSRRTLIRKYNQIGNELIDSSRDDLLNYEKDRSEFRLKRLIEEVWTTDEIREERPTAIDEAKWGFAVIESSLWHAVPDFIRHFDTLSQKHLGQPLPQDIQPFSFYSWMGGDRDGNPNVTHDITEHVILRGRWMAADLYSRDIYSLGGDLSMFRANDTLTQASGDNSREPYRAFLTDLRRKLEQTKEWCLAKLKNQGTQIKASELITHKHQLLEPLLACQKSLISCNMDTIANGPLLDIIRRVQCFGINLVPLDIRQDGERHTQLLDELTLHLDMGSYLSWDEPKRQSFLLEQLSSKRPLLPASWPCTEDTQEVIKTCKVIAKEPRETLSHYVISMAKQPSDVLAVALILKECGMSWKMPIVPLFETLDDLDRASSVMNQLWQLHWYQQYTDGDQTIMIGYSDSAKDAGKLAATWAQYKSQEQLVSLAQKHDIKLTLFHGRGGTVGRGGGPVEKAMASQPPGSVQGKIRVTEQGEMIRYKFGRERLAFKSLSTYVKATLRATLAPHAAPKEQWRELMELMSEKSLKAYRHVVRGHDQFVPYFRSLTPEQELNKLALGSRPAKRKATGGVESLRAIPWVFAWTQVRLNLPAWLGIYQALSFAQQEHEQTLNDMVKQWPFFASFLELLEMVLGKADGVICKHYEEQLVDKELRGLGKELRGDLENLETLLVNIKGQKSLLENEPELKNSLQIRRPYIDPLNFLQVELMRRERKAGKISSELERALKVTMAGIAAGMRNTG